MSAPTEQVAEAIRPLLVAEYEKWIGTAALGVARTFAPELARVAMDIILKTAKGE
jgi:hypothetical protein